jgi:uncharacterized repeat protein (TIGR01451 family)
MEEKQMYKYKFNRYLNTQLKAVLLVVVLLVASHFIPGIRSTFAAALVYADKVDFLVIDNDGDGMADPGDTIRYVVGCGWSDTIGCDVNIPGFANAGTTNATNVFFSDTIDANTTLVIGSVNSTPIARNDSYASTSSVGITVLAASGLLTNDNDPDGGTVTINSFDPFSVQGNIAGLATPNVSVAADGSFTYEPPPGFVGNDSFKYTIIDDESLVDPANVFITVSNLASQSGNLSLVKLVENVPAVIDLAPYLSKAWETASVLISDMVSGVRVTSAYASGETINLNLGTLNPGQEIVVTFDVTVDSTIPSGVTNVCNQGLITGDNIVNLFTSDPTVGFDSPTCTPIDSVPDMQIDKDDGGATVAAGGTIDYTLTFTNVGNADATGVVITDTVPANTTFNAGASTSGWVCAPDGSAGSTCTIAIGVVTGGGGSGLLSFAVDVDRPLTPGVELIANAATVADDGSGGADPNPGDNSSTDVTPVINMLPEVTIELVSVTVDEGQTAYNSGTVGDPDGDTVILTSSIGSVTNNNDGTWAWSFETSDGPAESQTVTIVADDGNGGMTQIDFSLAVNNVAPSVDTIIAPTDPVNIYQQPITISAVFSDPAGVSDAPYNCTIDYGDGVGAQTAIVSGTTCTGSNTYLEAGVFTILVTVADKDGGSGSAIYQFVVIYDPNGGFVTGGGWIDSPAGAYAPDPSLNGKATFGFVSKYKKGATVPSGNTEFQFQTADLNFHSDSYDWLVIAGAKAIYKGVGTINGMGNYGFLLSAIDGDLKTDDEFESDLFRIKIWDKDNGDVVLYDNLAACTQNEEDADQCTEIVGGSIVVHKGKKK